MYSGVSLVPKWWLPPPYKSDDNDLELGERNNLGLRPGNVRNDFGNIRNVLGNLRMTVFGYVRDSGRVRKSWHSRNRNLTAVSRFRTPFSEASCDMHFMCYGWAFLSYVVLWSQRFRNDFLRTLRFGKLCGKFNLN